MRHFLDLLSVRARHQCVAILFALELFPANFLYFSALPHTGGNYGAHSPQNVSKEMAFRGAIKLSLIVPLNYLNKIIFFSLKPKGKLTKKKRMSILT